MPKLWGVRKKNGRWYVEFQYRGKHYNGKGKSWPDNQGREAEAYAKKIKEELEKGLYVEETDKTVGEFTGEFIKDYLEPRERQGKIKISTLDTKKSNLKQIPTWLRKMKLKKITPKDVSDYQNQLLDKHSQNYARSIAVHFRELLGTAYKWEMISRNPAIKIDIIPIDRTKSEILKDEKVELLLNNVDEENRAIICSTRYQGMRPSEFTERKWKDIDFENDTIYIYNQRYKGNVITPKSKTGERVIPLTPQYKKAILIWRAKSRNKGPEDYIFKSETTENPISYNNWNTITYKPLLKKLGLPDIDFYKLRHNCTKMLYDNGWTDREVAYFLGDKTIRIVRDVYDHPDVNSIWEKAKHIQAFNTTMSGKKSGKIKENIG